LKDELSAMLGANAFYVISDEPSEKYFHGYINEEFLKKILMISPEISICAGHQKWWKPCRRFYKN